LTWLKSFGWLLAHRGRLGLFVLMPCVIALFGAARVQVDTSIERMHPFADQAREDFDRYQRAFPGQDALAFILVEGHDVFSPAGIRMLSRLEGELRGLPAVRSVVGPASARSIRGLLIPESARDRAEDIEQVLAGIRNDPQSRLLVHPTRALAVIQVEVATDRAGTRVAVERKFTDAARELLERYAKPGWKLTLSGAPAVRASVAGIVDMDMMRLMPLVVLAILAVVAAAYRDMWYLLATAATLGWTWLAMIGALGWMGVPVGVLTSFAPIVVLIVCVTDTVHILSDLDARIGNATPGASAIVEATAGAAGPCLATEIVIAGGFLSMGLIGLEAVWEFGLATAAGVMLAWVANMLVLPWVLSLRPASLARRGAGSHGGARARRRPMDAILRWNESVVVRFPWRVLACGAVVALACAVSMTRLQQEYRVFDDLRPESSLATDLAYAENALGGVVPIAIMLEPEGAQERAALSADALKFQSRVASTLGALAERPPVISLPGILEPAEQSLFVAMVGRSAETTALALRLVERVQRLDMVITPDRQTAQIVALLPNLATGRMREVVEFTRALAARETPPGYRATVTGNLVMTERVTGMLTQGLLSSFLAALAVSFIAFFAVLRSAKLALIGLIPNVLPLGVLFGLMPILGIGLKPSTVIIASMALVIADDDTLQYLLRFRRRFAALQAQGIPQPHRLAALDTLAECGRAMLVTSTAVTAGFLLLQFSQFEGIANLGLLTGLTLWSAALADAFLTPVLLMTIRPRLRATLPAAAPADDIGPAEV
jgi:predicted RND superfamily exporter protein